MYSFAEVVAALARVNRIAPEGEKAFRARLQNFQRLGLVRVTPGKGKRIDYSDDDVLIWAICLELAQFGIDPSVLKRFSERARSRIHWESVKNTQLSLIFYPTMFGKGLPAIPANQQSYFDKFGISYFFVSSIEDVVALGVVNKDPAAASWIEMLRARHGVIDLSSLLRRVAEALGRAP